MIAHPILSLLIPSSPGPDICHNLSTHTHTQHLCDARWWSHTYPKVYLRTRTHKSRFIGDNPMTANLLEGYTFYYFILYLSIASAFTRQFVRWPAGGGKYQPRLPLPCPLPPSPTTTFSLTPPQPLHPLACSSF